MGQETFLTTLDVMIDDYCQSHGFAEKHRPGPVTSLHDSEVVDAGGVWAMGALCP